jgi:GntR family phosphonate transport system transcriptional regulator
VTVTPDSNAGISGISLWRHVAEELRAFITRDEGDSDRLPTEAVLAARFGVNRHTVRRAISALTQEGILRAERGRGTFIVRRPRRLIYPVGPRMRFSETVTSQSLEPSGRLIRAESHPADLRTAQALDLRPGHVVHRLETLHVADGVPISVATSWFPADRFPGIVAAYAGTGSITKALAEEGLADYRRRDTRVTAEKVGSADAGHLGCALDAVVLVTVSINVEPDGRPIQLSRTRFLADRIELTFLT